MNFTNELGMRSKRLKVSMKVRYLASAVHVPFFYLVYSPSLYTEYFSEVIIFMGTTSHREVSTLKTF